MNALDLFRRVDARHRFDASAHKLLSGLRERYIRQSAATRNGVVAELPPEPEEPNDEPDCQG